MLGVPTDGWYTGERLLWTVVSGVSGHGTRMEAGHSTMDTRGMLHGELLWWRMMNVHSDRGMHHDA